MVEARRSIAVNNAHPRLRLTAKEIAAAIALLDAQADRFSGGCSPGELSIVFLTDETLAQIHADFMNDPSATDVITFEGNPAAGQAGEICVSVDTAARYVGLHLEKKAVATSPASVRRLKKFSTELTLYLVHGWLHLAGYDDLQPAKKRRMRAAEKRALALLRTNDALPTFRIG